MALGVPLEMCVIDTLGVAESERAEVWEKRAEAEEEVEADSVALSPIRREGVDTAVTEEEGVIVVLPLGVGVADTLGVAESERAEVWEERGDAEEEGEAESVPLSPATREGVETAVVEAQGVALGVPLEKGVKDTLGVTESERAEVWEKQGEADEEEEAASVVLPKREGVGTAVVEGQGVALGVPLAVAFALEVPVSLEDPLTVALAL